MGPDTMGDGFIYKGLIATFYKSFEDAIAFNECDFIVWGSLDYLKLSPIKTLSKISKDTYSGTSPSAKELETRNLYIYKKLSIENSSEDIKKIFDFNSEKSLIVISLIKVIDFIEFQNQILKYSQLKTLEIDVFETLGVGDRVVVFRGKRYEDIFDPLISLNSFCKNTYSIAGVANVFLKKNRFWERNKILFPNLILDEPDNRVDDNSYLTVKYILKESTRKSEKLIEVVSEIEAFRRKIVDIYSDSLLTSELNVVSYIEIGQYDIELKVEGHMHIVLQFLLDPEFGIANGRAKFYQEHIQDSKVIWQVPATYKLDEVQK